MPPVTSGVDMSLERSDVERLVGVEKDVKYLREKVDLFVQKQDIYNANVVKLNESHAVALDREKTTNRFWSITAGILGGLLPTFFGKH